MKYQSLVNYLNSKEDKYSYSMIIGNIYKSNHYIKTHSNTTFSNYNYVDKLIMIYFILRQWIISINCIK